MKDLTITGFHPISNNLTSTTLNADEIDFDSNNTIYKEKLEGNGRDWKRYNLLENAKGFARFHNDINKPNGHWLTLLWSITSIEAKKTLELPIESSAENKSLCEVNKDTVFWVGKHNENESDQIYIENEENLLFINSQITGFRDQRT